MKAKNDSFWKIYCVGFFLVTLVCCGVHQALAVPRYEVTRLTTYDGSYDELDPQINDRNQVVWVNRDPTFGGIMLYTPPARSGDPPEFRLVAPYQTDTYLDASSPQINNSGEVACILRKRSAVGQTVGDIDIFFYPGDGEPLIRVSYTPDVDDGPPALNDEGSIVWRGGFLDNTIPDQHIFCWDGSEAWQVTFDDYVNRSRPVLSNSGAFFWHEEAPGINRIQMSTTGNPGVVATVVEDVSHPDPIDDLAVKSQQAPVFGWRFNQTFLVWSEHREGIHQIFLLRRSPFSVWPAEVQQITDADTDQRYPQVNAQGQVVWEGIENATSHIYLYDTGTITRISPHNSFDNHRPQINDRGVVTWYGGCSTYFYPWNKIYVRAPNWEVSLVTSDIFDSVDNLNPKINNNGHIVWERCAGPNSSKRIYLGVPPGLAYGGPRYPHGIPFPRRW